MSPMMMRFFAAGIALAAMSLQMKTRAEIPDASPPPVQAAALH